jgi:acyl-CoA thioester hydrolase
VGSNRLAELDVAALNADPRVIWNEDVLRFSDTDMNGHVNNAAFAVFCESGRVNCLRGRLGPTREAGGYFVLAKVTIEFKAELHYPGRVRIATWIRSVGRTSVGFGQALFDEAGRLVATSEAVTVSMDGATRRPMPLDDATRDVAGGLLRSPP